MAAQPPLPTGGNVFLSVKDADKLNIVKLGKELVDLGFTIYATSGTAAALASAGLTVNRLFKLSEGRPHVIDMIKNDEIDLIINTPSDGPKCPRDPMQRLCGQRPLQESQATWIQSSSGETVQYVGICFCLKQGAFVIGNPIGTRS